MNSKIDIIKAYEKTDLTFRAYSWHPSNSEKISPCIIQVINGEPITIQYWEDLTAFVPLYRDLNFHPPLEVMFGKLENGKRFTVYNLRLENYKKGTGIPSITLVAQYIVIGILLLPQNVAVQSLHLRQQYLDEWTNLNPVEINYLKKEDSRKYTYNIELPHAQILHKSNDLEVLIVYSFNYPMQNVSRITVYPIPKLSILLSQPITINEAIMLREGFRILIQIFIGVKSSINETCVTTDNDETANVYVLENSLKNNFKNFGSNQVFINLQEILPFSSCIITNWLEIFKEHGEMIMDYFKVSEDKTLTNQRVIFLNAVKSIEMFYKIIKRKELLQNLVEGKKHDIKLKYKVKYFINLFPEITKEIIPDETPFINKVISTRNHYNHYNLTSQQGDPNIIPTRRLGVFSKRLELLVKFGLLLHLGVPEELINRRFKKHIDYFILTGENQLMTE